MKIRNILLLTVAILFPCCSTHYQLSDVAGYYTGGRKNGLGGWELNLHQDGICKICCHYSDLYGSSGDGTWTIRGKYIYVDYKQNPLKDDPLYALLSGGFFEGSDTIRILSNNRLKIHKVRVKRRKKK
jgi:hypothetical protein